MKVGRVREWLVIFVPQPWHWSFGHKAVFTKPGLRLLCDAWCLGPVEFQRWH